MKMYNHFDNDDLTSSFGSYLENIDSILIDDFSNLLEFDKKVESFLKDPVSIRYELDGAEKFYSPGFLIKYFKSFGIRSVLAHVGYREDLRRDWQILKPGFKAAKLYASKRNMDFRIYTDDYFDVGAYLDNIRFLSRYRNDSQLPDVSHKKILMEILEAVKVTTPEEIILIAFRDPGNRAELIPSLWSLISNGWIGCDLFDKLTMSSEIWCVTD